MAAKFEGVSSMVPGLVLLVIFFVPACFAATFTVEQSGKGNYTKIQDAINAVPSLSADPFVIYVSSGTYREKIQVPEDKRFVTIVGAGADSTIVSWNESVDVKESSTAMVLAADFVAINITFENTHGPGSQAPALRVSGDRVAFYSCRIRSFQDTLMDHQGRHYYKDCYVEGGTDFICGDGLALFENCDISTTSRNGGALTAQKRNSTKSITGFSFVNCRINGSGPAFLGRPWGNFSTTVFANSFMSGGIVPQGWDDWGKPSSHNTVFYGEYNCSGPGSDRSKRVSWSRSLTFTEVAPYLNISMINGETWLKPHPPPSPII